MTMNPLPPQAYTKETMLKAYQWLMVQNSSIKEMATTPDILVSLYLKATRDGSAALDRPSIQNFKNELRSLAGMMGELERADRRETPTVAPAATPAPPPPQTVTVMAAPAVAPAPTPAPAATMPPPVQSQTQVSYTEKTLTATTREFDVIESLDCCSKEMIQEVKVELNLSSDLEALRMLIKIGYGRAKGLMR